MNRVEAEKQLNLTWLDSNTVAIPYVNLAKVLDQLMNVRPSQLDVNGERIGGGNMSKMTRVEIEARITQHKATPHQERLWCECGGEMIFNGAVKPMYPPLYCHSCESCKKTVDIRDQKYPSIVWTFEDE